VKVYQESTRDMELRGKNVKSLDQFSRPGESIGVTVMPGESMRFSPTCNKLV